MFSLLIAVALIGLVAWVLVTFVPLPAPFPKIVIGLAVVFALLVLCKAFGVLPLHDVAVPQIQ